MPVRVVVGCPDQAVVPKSSWAVWDRFSTSERTVADRAEWIHCEFWLPFLWQTRPLDRISSYLAVGEPIPPPWTLEIPPDYSQLVRYQNLIDEGKAPRYRSALLENPECIYLPHVGSSGANDKLSEGDSSPQVSTQLLWTELEHLTSSLFEAREGELPTLAHAWSALKDDSTNQNYAVERYSALIIRQATRLAISTDLPLFLVPIPTLKPRDQTFSYSDEHLFGLTTFVDAGVEREGTVLRVEFAGSYQYVIPISYLRLWFDSDDKVGPDDLLAAARIRSADDDVLELHFTRSGRRTLIPSEILTRCEPTYFEFGDLPQEERAKSSSWLEDAAKMRVILVERRSEPRRA